MAILGPLGLAAACDPPPEPAELEKLAFWGQPRKGANAHTNTMEPEYWQAAAELGIEFARLIPDSWSPADRDFLIGDADAFAGLQEADLVRLEEVLDDAHAAGVRIVLTMFSLPGARWRQLNDDVDDYRLWHEDSFQRAAADFWRQLAERLEAHPAIVGYNPLNEPHPEKEVGITGSGPEFEAWLESVEGTAADINVFNRRIVAAIREVDPTTPIILEGGVYASPEGVELLEPLDDPAVLYAFHFYEPWIYTTYRVNRERFAYPDRMPVRDPAGGRLSGAPEDGQIAVTAWSAETLQGILAPVADWAARHSIPAHRIIASEFGVDRKVPGARQYLEDLISIFNAYGWHWAFYNFRGDGGWGGMDYELGTGRMGGAYWEAVEQGEDPEDYKRRGDNPLWDVIKREFQSDSASVAGVVGGSSPSRSKKTTGAAPAVLAKGRE